MVEFSKGVYDSERVILPVIMVILIYTPWSFAIFMLLLVFFGINKAKGSLFTRSSTLDPTLSQWNEVRSAYNILTPKSQGREPKRNRRFYEAYF
jgi:hypothetical protein